MPERRELTTAELASLVNSMLPPDRQMSEAEAAALARRTLDGGGPFGTFATTPLVVSPRAGR